MQEIVLANWMSLPVTKEEMWLRKRLSVEDKEGRWCLARMYMNTS